MGIKAWITVNGNHIPIMDGESKMEAIGKFIKNKRPRKIKGDLVQKRLKERNRLYHSEYRKLQGTTSGINRDALAYNTANSEMLFKYGDNWRYGKDYRLKEDKPIELTKRRLAEINKPIVIKNATETQVRKKIDKLINGQTLKIGKAAIKKQGSTYSIKGVHPDINGLRYERIASIIKNLKEYGIIKK